MANRDLPLTLTVRAASKYSGLGEHVLRDAIAANELPHIKVGRRILIPVDGLKRFVSDVAKRGADLAQFRSTRRRGWASKIGDDQSKDA
jgi:excisionase family DNA binding protein